MSHMPPYHDSVAARTDDVAKLQAELAAQRAENARLMDLLGHAMNPPAPADMRADYLAAHLWLTQEDVPMLIEGKPATLAERVKLLVASRGEARMLARDAQLQAMDRGASYQVAVAARDDAAARLDRLDPLRTVLRSWDWAQLLEDERIPDEAVMPLLRAFAHVEAEENKTKQAKESSNG